STARSDDGPGDLVAARPRDVAVEHRDVVRVDAQQLQRGVAVAGDVGRDRFEPQAIADGVGQIGLVLDDQHTRARMVTGVHISPAYRKPHTGRQHHDPLTAPMAYDPAAQPRARLRPRTLVTCILAVAIAIAGVLGAQSLTTSSTAASPL